ncbi:hypothetical protein M0G43_05335 [Subsaxibacter sp. CAU 1640]|uniref:hypothetical protein n=1 Tax=Subsaxibacter sp. CAU 1640 TaxID=2933271 RepID=UPI002002A1FC|nr:hypothetical protein [Subsaxibacter sp. CAU 1640]MCK7589990.1 hypothetical protein [Subsaxibacter sp. CAU 1640]
MKHLNEIASAKYGFITNIREPEEYVLEFHLEIAQISDNDEDVIIGNQNIGPARRIYVDEKSPKFKIRFNNYIGYSTINESYARQLEGEFTGINPRIYTESNFLYYIKKDSFASKDYPGEFKHYAFLSDNLIMNIASQTEPEIIKLK